MIVTIDCADIAAGWRRDALLCPVARAIRKAAPWNMVWVRRGRAGVGGEVYQLPSKVVKWIMDFDGGRDVQPISFDLRVKL